MIEEQENAGIQSVAVLENAEAVPSRHQRRRARKAGKKTLAEKLAAMMQRPPKDYNQLEHRLKHDSYKVGGEERGGLTMTTISDPLRIDKLLSAHVIDENQHLSGMQLITLWTIANRPFCGSMNYGEVRSGYNQENGKLSRMTAEDQFYRTMMYLATPHLDYLNDVYKCLAKKMSRKERSDLHKQLKIVETIDRRAHKRAHDLICLVCFEEIGVIEAARMAGVGINDAAQVVKSAFDSLGEALKKMRNHRKHIEENSAPA